MSIKKFKFVVCGMLVYDCKPFNEIDQTTFAGLNSPPSQVMACFHWPWVCHVITYATKAELYHETISKIILKNDYCRRRIAKAPLAWRYQIYKLLALTRRAFWKL